MPREHRLPPSAASLSASMRDIGYSLETAIADLIDNSISANATKVEIYCDLTHSEPMLAILDNGSGMTQEEVVEAMRHGSTNPKEERNPHDLGRFGLGLKTASFSQCRKLTVVSAQDGIVSGAEWDLNLVDEKDDWIVTIPEEEEISEIPFMDHLGYSGTIIIWRSLDRLFEDEIGKKRDEIVSGKLSIVEKHLSLVFHRFLSGEVKHRKKLSITVNGHKVKPFDPFCRKNSATQMLPEEIIRTRDATVRMQPYILPHHSKLSASEYDFYQSRSDFISNQGAYIYRNGRLMAWGDWFRLVSKGEATKLARVQIDFPSNHDELWTIDIKKSRARPPHAVRERLRQVITRITARSATVHQGRGKKLFEEIETPLWERYADQGCIRYALSKEHPLIEALNDNLNTSERRRLELLLRAVSSALPVEMIYSDFSTHPKDVKQSDTDKDVVIDILRELRDSLFEDSEGDAESFRQVMRSTRLFEKHLGVAEDFICEEFK